MRSTTARSARCQRGIGQGRALVEKVSVADPEPPIATQAPAGRRPPGDPGRGADVESARGVCSCVCPLLRRKGDRETFKGRVFACVDTPLSRKHAPPGKEALEARESEAGWFRALFSRSGARATAATDLHRVRRCHPTMRPKEDSPAGTPAGDAVGSPPRVPPHPGGTIPWRLGFVVAALGAVCSCGPLDATVGGSGTIGEDGQDGREGAGEAALGSWCRTARRTDAGVLADLPPTTPPTMWSYFAPGKVLRPTAPGPDGKNWYYTAWVWRNPQVVPPDDFLVHHNVSAARSLDLETWQDTCGRTLSLPMTLANAEVVDPVPALPGNTGLMNNLKLGFDHLGRPIVTYERYDRYDSMGRTQVYNARLEATGWVVRQATRWHVRSVKAGVGSLPSSPLSVGFSGVMLADDGTTLYQSLGPSACEANLCREYLLWAGESPSAVPSSAGVWRLDPETMAPLLDARGNPVPFVASAVVPRISAMPAAPAPPVAPFHATVPSYPVARPRPLSYQSDPSTAVAGAVIGFVDGVDFANGLYRARGWACQKNDGRQLVVRILAGDSAYASPSGALIAEGRAALSSEPSVNAHCESSGSTLRAYRFVIPFGATLAQPVVSASRQSELFATHGGQPLYAHGVAIDAARRSNELVNSGKLVIPGLVALRSLSPRSTGTFTYFLADWEGSGTPVPGSYDGIDRTYYRYRPNGTTSATFGPKVTVKFPLVGDWDGNGSQTFGLYFPSTDRYVLKNSLAGGYGDVSLSLAELASRIPPTSVHGFHHKTLLLPRDKYVLTWHTFPTSNDLPRDCDGDGAVHADVRLERNGCANFVTELILREYDEASAAWKAPSIVDRVWAGTNVGFDFMAMGDDLLVGYYDAQRRLTVAVRKRDATAWVKASLPSVYAGWDSHNNIRLGVDEVRRVHVAGNMHATRLVYFRGARPELDLNQMEGPLTMSGDTARESSVTYHDFINGPQGRLYFIHRGTAPVGFSDGRYWINRFDEPARRWVNVNAGRPLVSGIVPSAG